MQVLSLAREDPLEEGIASHPNILAWRIPVDRGAWQATVHGVAKSWTRLKQLSSSSSKQIYGYQRAGLGGVIYGYEINKLAYYT